MVGGIAFHIDKKETSLITVETLRDVLNDDRIRSSFQLCPTANYPGLAISSGGDDNWYLGYIDLFDGTLVFNGELGARDGKNPFHEDDVPQYSNDWIGPR